MITDFAVCLKINCYQQIKCLILPTDPCAAGSYSKTGYRVDQGCTLCPLHHYQDRNVQTKCVPCTDGTFTVAAGNTDHTACVAITGERMLF